MSKSISILDKDYLQWVKELSIRYRQSQIKAAIKVNSVLIEFYWSLGSDIIALGADNKYGGRFYATLSADLRKEMPGIEGLSETNIRLPSGSFNFIPIIPEIFHNLWKNCVAFLGGIIDTRWSQAASLSAYPNTSCLNSIPPKWKEPYPLSKRLKQG